MISGTSKISLNLGPINGHFWARGPRNYCLIIGLNWLILSNMFLNIFGIIKAINTGSTGPDLAMNRGKI